MCYTVEFLQASFYGRTFCPHPQPLSMSYMQDQLCRTVVTCKKYFEGACGLWKNDALKFVTMQITYIITHIVVIKSCLQHFDLHTTNFDISHLEHSSPKAPSGNQEGIPFFFLNEFCNLRTSSCYEYLGDIKRINIIEQSQKPS